MFSIHWIWDVFGFFGVLALVVFVRRSIVGGSLDSAFDWLIGGEWLGAVIKFFRSDCMVQPVSVSSLDGFYERVREIWAKHSLTPLDDCGKFDGIVNFSQKLEIEFVGDDASADLARLRLEKAVSSSLVRAGVSNVVTASYISLLEQNIWKIVVLYSSTPDGAQEIRDWSEQQHRINLRTAAANASPPDDDEYA